MLYSAVSQPPGTPWAFIHGGTPVSSMALQITRVSPKFTRTLPWGKGRDVELEPDFAHRVGGTAVDSVHPGPSATRANCKR